MLGQKPSKKAPEEFIDELYRDNADSLLAFFARRTFDVQVAMDLTAETFAIALEQQSNCRARTTASRRAWLFAIGRTTLAGFYRSGEVETRAVGRLAIEIPRVSDSSLREIERWANLAGARQLMSEAMTGLSDEHREALRLRVIDERPYAAVAAELGITEQTARARVSRALKSLRESLGDESGELMEAIENV
jgi:RNA polymerase sigma-70 factor (ECF subfamily)